MLRAVSFCRKTSGSNAAIGAEITNMTFLLSAVALFLMKTANFRIRVRLCLV